MGEGGAAKPRKVREAMTIEFEINGQKLTATPGQMIIQVADAAGIYIPRFCYHKHLSIAANCRMCLVEVEKSPKTLPACATPVTAGMKVFTTSAKAIAAQKAVMEFLLINHPLDCPICDQGGECELQDLAMGFGSSHSSYYEGKRSVADEDLGPLIETEMTRCIQCTRCVRFGDEIAGLPELGVVNRGEIMEISTYIGKSMCSELSGNVIDLCPVGALTSKPFRFSARAWELDQHDSVSPHDCLGSNLHVHTRYGKVMRVVPRENKDINQVWISDRDRFSYEGLNHSERLTKPLIRVNNHWQETSWPEAIKFAVDGMQKILVETGPDQLAALASPNSTVEEFYLLQKFMRQLGSHHIDHRLRQQDFQDQNTLPIAPGLKMLVSEIANCDAILLLGSNIQKEQPIAGVAVRQASLQHAKIMAVNMIDYRFIFPVVEKKIVSPQTLTTTLAKIAKALCEHNEVSAPTAWKTYLQDVVTDVTEKNIAATLLQSKKGLILLGAPALNHYASADIRNLARMIAEMSGVELGILTEGANAAGAWLSGAVPHRLPAGVPIATPGLTAHEMLKNPRQVYVLLNVEPELDCSNSVLAEQALANAKCIVALSSYKNPLIEKYAQVILPIAPFTETSGTYVNVSGQWQSFRGVATPLGETRPAWKVLRVLANLFQLNGFDYVSSSEVLEEFQVSLQSLLVNLPNVIKLPQEHFKPSTAAKVCRVGDIPLYALDSLSRHASSLQKIQTTIEGQLVALRISSATATQLNLQAGQSVSVRQQQSIVELLVEIDERVATGAALIFGGIAGTKNLGELFGEITIT